MRILVVEDEFTLADIIAGKLKNEKYDVDISLNGEEGLYNALSGVYDLIILDIMLPIKELIARVNVQLRSNDKNINKDILTFGDIELNVRTSTITCVKNNESINISYKELMILEYLMNNTNQVISKEQIYELSKYDKIWGIDTDFESNNLEAYLSFVRKKLKIIDSNVTIKAIRGMGYKLEK